MLLAHARGIGESRALEALEVRHHRESPVERADPPDMPGRDRLAIWTRYVFRDDPIPLAKPKLVGAHPFGVMLVSECGVCPRNIVVAAWAASATTTTSLSRQGCNHHPKPSSTSAA